jgi:hypothetical protein
MKVACSPDWNLLSRPEKELGEDDVVVELAAVVVVVAEPGVDVVVVAAVVTVVVDEAAPAVVVVLFEPVPELLQPAATTATRAKKAPRTVRPDLKLPASFVICSPYRSGHPLPTVAMSPFRLRADASNVSRG